MNDGHILTAAGTLPEDLRGEFISYVRSNRELNEELRADPYLLTNRESIRRLVVDMLRMSRYAYRDAVTGLRNRRFFEEQMPIVFAQAIRDYRDMGKKLSVALVDMIGLKYRNDTFGMDLGDAHLRLLASTLEKTHRDSDFVVRYGGDEFVAVEPRADRPTSLKILKKARDRLVQLDTAPKIEIYTGIGTLTEGMKRYEELIEQAEHELTLQKKRLKHPLARD